MGKQNIQAKEVYYASSISCRFHCPAVGKVAGSRWEIRRFIYILFMRIRQKAMTSSAFNVFPLKLMIFPVKKRD